MNFEFKMASLGNVVFIDRRIMDVAFLISLTHKNFFVLPFRTEHSTYFILSKVFHFVGRLKHKEK